MFLGKAIDSIMKNKIGLLRFMVLYLWFGPFKKLFRAIMRHTVGKNNRVILGPLKGMLFTSRALEILGIYEAHVQEALCDNLKEGDIFYDVGANVGYFSLLGLKLVGPKGYVYAFEPLPDHVTTLRHNMYSNGFSNYTVVPDAVSNFVGKSDFYLEGGGRSETSSFTPRLGGIPLVVNTITLDAFVKKTPWPNVIKVDVEGAEVLVLQGALQILSKASAPIWIVEIHTKEHDDLVREILSRHGYHINTLRSFYKTKRVYPLHVIVHKTLR